MPPRIHMFSASRSLVFRPKTSTSNLHIKQPLALTREPLRRGFADSKDLPKAEKGATGLNGSLPHVTEEAAATAKITGGEGPDLTQGTPVKEAVEGDKKAQENLPKVMQQEMKTNKSSGSRSFSTSARQSQLDTTDQTLVYAGPPRAMPPIRFQRPEITFGRDRIMKYRYHDVVEQVTNLIMRDGKKSEAQRHTALVLSNLQLASPPVINPARPLVPGAPPPSHLPLNPVLFMTLAIDSVAPLLRLRQIKGGAGGGQSLPIPTPLHQRQRRRKAIEWILQAASKRKGGVGKTALAQRVADELVAVVEGRSSVWQKRQELHKQAVVARANITAKVRVKKSFR